jgi:hypothetical protein
MNAICSSCDKQLRLTSQISHHLKFNPSHKVKMISNPGIDPKTGFSFDRKKYHKMQSQILVGKNFGKEI